MKASNEVVKALAVCSELCGANLSDGAARVIVGELSDHDEADVLSGLKAMRRTHEGRFSLAAVLRFVAEARTSRLSALQKCCVCGQPSGRSLYCLEHNAMRDVAATAKPLSWHLEQYRKKLPKSAA